VGLVSLSRELLAALAAPFDPKELDWKPQTVKENRGLLVAYIDARCVMRRLDAVIAGGWDDHYTVIDANKGIVMCRLTILGTERSDVGEGHQDANPEKVKAGFSDALKRAAVKFGVGRYLYDLPTVWADLDQYKRPLRVPKLPSWAIPAVN
jgi:hypothetical protein